MTVRILKYPLEIADEQELFIPQNSKCVLLAVQTGKLCLWLEVQDDKPKYPHTIRLIGTGYPIEDLTDYDHVGSVIMLPFVWHAYLGKYNGQ